MGIDVVVSTQIKTTFLEFSLYVVEDGILSKQTSFIILHSLYSFFVFYLGLNLFFFCNFTNSYFLYPKLSLD